MTQLLQQAIAEIEKLPPEEQDTFATRILAELADDRAWDGRFSATNNNQWDRMAAMVRRQIAAGETAPLDDLFPPDINL